MVFCHFSIDFQSMSKFRRPAEREQIKRTKTLKWHNKNRNIENGNSVELLQNLKLRIDGASVMFLQTEHWRWKKNSHKHTVSTNTFEWVKKKLTRCRTFKPNQFNHMEILWVCEHFITFILSNRLIFIYWKAMRKSKKRTEKPIKMTIENNSNEFFVCDAREPEQACVQHPNACVFPVVFILWLRLKMTWNDSTAFILMLDRFVSGCFAPFHSVDESKNVENSWWINHVHFDAFYFGYLFIYFHCIYETGSLHSFLLLLIIIVDDVVAVLRYAFYTYIYVFLIRCW